MSLFAFFKNEKQSEIKKYSKLHDQLQREYPFLSEEELVITACVAGLLARVAYVDFNLDEGEVSEIKKILEEWTINDKVHTELLAEMAINHIQEMAGLENHLYVHPLREHLTRDEKYRVLQSLFLVAASDGSVESIESEEIRVITKGLELSTQHFVAARAEVSQYLKALN